jgi:hypothetical protein
MWDANSWSRCSLKYSVISASVLPASTPEGWKTHAHSVQNHSCFCSSQSIVRLAEISRMALAPFLANPLHHARFVWFTYDADSVFLYSFTSFSVFLGGSYKQTFQMPGESPHVVFRDDCPYARGNRLRFHGRAVERRE